MGLHISLRAEPIFSLFGLTVTNSLLMGWITIFILASLAIYLNSRLSLRPGGLQVMFETVINGLYDLFQSILGDKIKYFFPLIATLFLYIIVSNWLGLLPGVGTIGIFKKEVVAEEKNTPVAQEKTESSGSQEHDATIKEKAQTQEHSTAAKEQVEFIPLFRAATADLNTTLALALISVFLLQVYGLKFLGPKVYISKFINFSNPIMFFVGILELIGEVSRVISFAFRLFGNIFAGEVLLSVIAFLIPILVPIPFMAMEIFVGFIQALVFSMLTAVFLNLATEHVSH